MNRKGFREHDKRGRGITLIEVVIVIAMLAILLGIALPGYRQYVLRANRTEAMDILLDTAACQQRVYTMFKRYDPARCDIGASTAKGYYTITMATSNVDQSFTLTAIAQLDQVQDSCGNLTLTDQGERGSSVTTDGARISDCWREK